ncbi:MAG TPA: cation diffusion facilitator family transporter, partial [Amaricoccus sp.]|nr:cation diffusion facilitator family transporter [Amaricoccus sp.]
MSRDAQHHHDGHDHHDGHHHQHAAAASARAIGIAALLTGGFMLVEVIGGVLSGSLALIADAGHMLIDFAALAMAWLAFRIARRPADSRRTYGFDRLSVLAAFVNGLALFAITAWIVVEAVERIAEPRPIEGGLMLAVAVAGL